MAIKSKASVKADFEAGDVPTCGQYVDLIDSSYTGEIGAAIVSAVSAGGTGLIEVTDASSVTLNAVGSAGRVLIASDTQVSARNAIGAQEDVITTQGDLVVGNASGEASRLPIGTDSQVVTVSASSVKWKDNVAASAATTAEVIDGSVANKYISPGLAQYHNGTVVVWAQVTIAGGSPSVAASYNLQSVTDTSVGVITYNYAASANLTFANAPVVGIGINTAANSYTTFLRGVSGGGCRQVTVSGTVVRDFEQAFLTVVGSASAS